MSGQIPDDLFGQGERRTPRHATLTLAQIIERFQPEFDKLLLMTLMLPWGS